MAPTSRHTPYFEVRDALGESGCALCTLVSRSLTRYISSLLYESVNSPPARQRLRDSLGLCASHNELVREARSASGAAIIQRDLLKTLSTRLANNEQSGTSGWLEDLFRPPKANRGGTLTPEQLCPACVAAEERERDYVDVLLTSLDDAEMLAALRASAGLCAPHLRMALSRARGAQAERIKAEQLVIWQRLIAELDEFIRKLDYRFTHEGMGAEGDAWDRALDLVAGKTRVMGSRVR
jgi:hypothetical protein